MSLYFNNRGGFKLNNVLAQREQTTKIINELARRKNISKAEKGKKRKRKPKSKGKHRKKKGLKSTEITIDNQPTQQVRGYSVVNVISSKRGPYKKRDRGLSGQEPIGNFNYRGKKGSFGKGDKSAYDLSQFTGLVKGASDDRYTGDPKDRETLKGLRRQVDRIEQRLLGQQPPPPPPQQPPPPPPQQPRQPPQQQQQQQQPPQQQQRQTPKRQPPPTPPKPPPRNAKTGGVKYQPPASPLMGPNPVVSNVVYTEEEIADGLGIPYDEINKLNMSELEQLARKYHQSLKQKSVVPEPTISGGTAGSPSPTPPQTPQTTPRPPQTPQTTPRPSNIGDAIKSALGEETVAEKEARLRRRAQFVKAQKQLPSPPPPTLTPTQSPAPTEDQKQLAKELKIPVEKVMNMTDIEFMTLLSQIPTKSPAPKKTPTASPRPIFNITGPSLLTLSPAVSTVSSPLGSLSTSPVLLQLKKINTDKTARDMPFPRKRYQKRKTKSTKRNAEIEQLQQERLDIGATLEPYIPKEFFMKGKGYLSKSKFSKLKEWSKTNLQPERQQKLSDLLDEWNVLFTKEKIANKKFKEETVSGGSAVGELYTLPENPVEVALPPEVEVAPAPASEQPSLVGLDPEGAEEEDED